MIPGEARYLVGLIGAEIGTSLSPQLHEREADQLGLRLATWALGAKSGTAEYAAAEAEVSRTAQNYVAHPRPRLVPVEILQRVQRRSDSRARIFQFPQQRHEEFCPSLWK